MRRPGRRGWLVALSCWIASSAGAGVVNFEVSHVHPIDLTPSQTRLLVVNTPDARLEVFGIKDDGAIYRQASVSVGTGPVGVVARTDSEAWVVNHLSDSISIVDLGLGVVTETLSVGDEPTDVAFAGGKAFVAVSQEDRVKVFDLANLAAAPAVLEIFGEDPRALVVSNDGSQVFAVVQQSGNQTTVLHGPVVHLNDTRARLPVLLALGLNPLECTSSPPPYPPLPTGIVRNPALIDPPSGLPLVGLIVRWNETAGQWQDEIGQDWSHCLPYRLPDNDLFVIDVASLAVSTVKHLGTTLFEVSVNPANGKIYVPNTESRNFVRFEHPLGVQGHIVDNRLSVVDPAQQNAVQVIDLNTHIDRNSDPTNNLAERLASVSQPGMMAWKSDGSAAYMTAIGSRKVFEVDGTCLTGSCIFGATRSTPNAVEVGNGPTGVALLESKNLLYVLNRIDNAVAVVDTTSLSKIGEVPLLDRSGLTVRSGRITLYDAIATSGHGDASCASCHIFGDVDGLAWDLGNPAGDFTPYGTPGDNLRFVRQELFGNGVETCDPVVCADHSGFDPQKGPMTTQTLRAMIEPLHWRGDRGTLNEFNGAFVSLMGKEDIGPINGKPAGVSAQEMETFRQFLLAIPFGPNPHRNVDDTLPNAVVTVPGHTVSGNPTVGETIFNTVPTDGPTPCAACHNHPFGTNGGKLGGIEPTDPPDPSWAGVHRGSQVQSLHSDIKIPHLRSMYEKYGPLFGDHVGPPPESKSGFGFSHDGSVPDLATLFSFRQFLTDAQQVRDVSTFTLHFPTGTKPAVGRQVTLPAGTPPTGSTEEEALLTQLVTLGDGSDVSRHCELVAATVDQGRRRVYRLDGGAWVQDAVSDPALTTTQLRESADQPLTFTCTPLGSGARLGGDRDEDGVLDGDDCASDDPLVSGPAVEVQGLVFDAPNGVLAWQDQSAVAGTSAVYEVFSGALSDLPTLGIDAAECLEGSVPLPGYDDARPDPFLGDGYFYLVRARNECGAGSLGAGRQILDAKTCP